MDIIYETVKDYWHQVILGFTAVNGTLLQLRESSKTDYITFLLTGLVAADSIATPFFAEGRTLHDIIGLSPQSKLELEIKFYERLFVAGSNLILYVKGSPTRKIYN